MGVYWLRDDFRVMRVGSLRFPYDIISFFIMEYVSNEIFWSVNVSYCHFFMRFVRGDPSFAFDMDE